MRLYVQSQLIEKLNKTAEELEICELMKDDKTRNLFVKYYPNKIEPESGTFSDILSRP
jgi:hypothetical protein